MNAPKPALLLLTAVLPALASSPATAQESEVHLAPAGGPAAFVPNLGQWEHPASYVVRTPGMTTFLEPRGFVFTLEERGADPRAVAIRVRFAGSETTPQLEPGSPLPGYRNYFLGKPERWRTHVPGYADVRYSAMYPGVDVRLSVADGKWLEYDVLAEPGADLSQVVIEVEGHRGMWVDGDGSLVLETEAGPVRQPAPPTFEVREDGHRTPTSCRYVVHDSARFGFAAPSWSGRPTLLIDPPLLHSTYLGDQGDDVAMDIWVDPSSYHHTVTGYTTSPNYPTTAGAYNPGWSGVQDAFVTRMNFDLNRLVWSTYVGGSGKDSAQSLARDTSNWTVTIAGMTDSTDFPVTRTAFQTGNHSAFDAFVAQLGPQGDRIIFSTYLGGHSDDRAEDVVVNHDSTVTVAGAAGGYSFPTTPGAYNRIHRGGYDAFVSRLDASGSKLLFSTLLGGTGIDRAQAVADNNGVITVAGFTESANFPVSTQAWDRTHGGNYDGFVTRFNKNGDKITYSTFVGGKGTDYLYDMQQHGAVADIFVTGVTTSSDFPTTPDAYDRTLGGPSDAFVVRLPPDLHRAEFSTFVGGSGDDWAYSLDVNYYSVTLAGHTDSTDFPIDFFSHCQPVIGGNYDGFVAQLDAGGERLVFSTYLGGSDFDTVTGVQFDGVNRVSVAGYTWSQDYPTTPNSWGPLPKGYPGSIDAFVTNLHSTPEGVARYGRSTAQCWGHLTIHALGDAVVGNSEFGFGGFAPVQAQGLLMLSTQPDNMIVFGFRLLVDPTPGNFVAGAVSTGRIGMHTIKIPLGNWAKGLRVYAQYGWLHQCSGLWTVVSTDAVVVAVR